ncbi:oligoendopeptidase F [Candidatus Izimaplasma bacterium ZiA1]|uniref:M3 family oligoendopeptidase n=1 Tax=Candidatus Izimoplasma sp. ZiA1 TaxID=2024899 RepID=UPI000BAA3F85|nr:oligoendopeptidase F [Candidatus Izimaplasma bacterium ZiA1]
MSNTKWDLSKLYASYESPEFKKDFASLDEYIKKAHSFKEKFQNNKDQVKTLRDFLILSEEVELVIGRLYSFCGLQTATNTTDEESNNYVVQLQMKLSEFTEPQTLFVKFVSQIENFEDVIKNDEMLSKFEYILKESVKTHKFNFNEKTETLLSKLGQSGSGLWGRLQSVLTSTLEVEYNGETITLPEVRNLAYDKEQEVRKNAFLAELESYKKIDKSIAFALNGIKSEVNTITSARGYQGGLDKSLINSRIQKSTLDAMLEAMKDSLPEFVKYFQRKAKILGHKGGLPFYDLFAPIGASAKEFSIEEAQKYIIDNFKTFSPHLEDLATRAFNDNWIDYVPYKGKVGGAFCANLNSIKESRILSNFTGSFSDVITLAHELGHAYHGDNVFNESVLNAEYTMPVAETASTFCETIVMKSALRDAEKEEKIYLLESSLQDASQVIVDILSRYLFEESVFDGTKTGFLDENKLKELMESAQLQAYGEGLDKDYLHPYMWVNKGHYYSGNLSFYNWPYAFGLLFAKGLYKQYQEQGESFTGKYDKLLQNTGKLSVEDVAKLANIDVTDKQFWMGSLDIIKEDIKLFLELTK